METLDYLTNFYSNYDENNRLASKAGQVEFLTTMKYIDKYLDKSMRILEVGAGTGRYSLALAEKGYHVDAVELVGHNIDIFKSRITEGVNVDIRQGNAVDLSFFQDGVFDITLLLGPMYHLFNNTDRIKALSEAVRVTKKGGVIFVAYCMNEATVYSECFLNDYIFKAIEQGIIDLETFKCLSEPAQVFVLYRKEEIDALMTQLNSHTPNPSVERLHFVATDLMTLYFRKKVNEMDDEMYKLYLQYHFSVCERLDLIGISHHGLDVFTKLP